jgi:uncharacterized membrane protein YoaK (UPF0700 family)
MLTLASGLVDIIGYLGVFHLFTAHLTGTTVQFGHSLIDRTWGDALPAGVILFSFVAGSLFGRAMIEIGSRRRIRRIASVTLAIEALMLAGLAETSVRAGGFTSHTGSALGPLAGLAVIAGAMGIQTATLTGIGPLTVHTTFVTGMLNKLAQLVSHIAFRTYDSLRTRLRDPQALRNQREDLRRAALLSAIWLFYVGGAALGTWLYRDWGLGALFIAVAFLTASIAIDQSYPLSIREEKEQSER